MTWNCIGKYIFSESLYEMGSALILICPSRLVRTSSLLYSISSLHEHNLCLFTLCVDSITDVFFPDTPLISNAMAGNCFWIVKMLWPNYAWATSSFVVTNKSLLLLLWLYSPCGPWTLFQSPNLYTVGRTNWTGDQLFARPLPTHRTAQSQNKHKHKHPCLEWYSNPRCQCSSKRARPLWSTLIFATSCKFFHCKF
jgi:hypothetical protein